MKRERSPQEIQDMDWRPQRIYSSRLEAWPTHYPEWWEPPPVNHTGRWLRRLALFVGGLAGLLLMI